jgi:hypothetical protein
MSNEHVRSQKDPNNEADMELSPQLRVGPERLQKREKKKRSGFLNMYIPIEKPSPHFKTNVQSCRKRYEVLTDIKYLRHPQICR